MYGGSPNGILATLARVYVAMIVVTLFGAATVGIFKAVKFLCGNCG